MELELLQDVIDRIRPLTPLVNSIEYITGSLHRQRRYVERLAIRRDGGYPGCDADTYPVQLTQFLYRAVYFLSVRPLWV